MDLDELLGIDPADPVSQHAERLVAEDWHDFPARLKAGREANGVTREQVAHRMGLGVRHVNLIENGGRDLDMATARRYALAAGLTIRHEVTQGRS